MTYYLTYSQSAYQLTRFNDDGLCELSKPHPLISVALDTSSFSAPSVPITTIDERMSYLRAYHVEKATGFTFSYLGPVSSPSDFQHLYPEHFL